MEPPLFGTFIIWELSLFRQPKIGHVGCSFLTIKKFGSQGGRLKVAVYLFGGLFIQLPLGC